MLGLGRGFEPRRLGPCWWQSSEKVEGRNTLRHWLWWRLLGSKNTDFCPQLLLSHPKAASELKMTVQRSRWSGIQEKQLLSNHLVVSDSATPWTTAHQASPSFTVSWSLLKLMFFESMMPSNHLILCRLLLLLPSIFPSVRVFSNELVLCIRWPKYWRFSFSVSPSSEYSGLISFGIDWFDLLAVQGTLKSLLQHHSSDRIASSVLRLLYGPILTSIQDYWKNCSFGYTDQSC